MIPLVLVHVYKYRDMIQIEHKAHVYSYKTVIYPIAFSPPLSTHLKSLSCKFLVILGNLTRTPLSSLLILT